MRPKGPTFWLLDGRTGWRTAHAEGVSVGVVSGIRLAADPAGPLALTSADGSLGGLTLPRGMALDDQGTLHLLGLNAPWWVKRFDPAPRRFVSLPEVGGSGRDARQFQAPANIAIAGRNLYVADWGNRRVQVFDLGSLALRHVWGPWDADGRPTAPDAPDVWEPVDVTAQPGVAYVLDRRYGRVHRHRPGTDGLHPVIDEPAAANRWARIAVDREGRIYLLDPYVPRLEIYDPQGRRLGEAKEAGDVSDRFAPPPVRLDHHDRFCLPESLVRLCDRRAPTTPPAPEIPLALCPPWSEDGLIFDREGNPARVNPAEEAPGRQLYKTVGTWISEALDSQIYRCQWHRIELDLLHLPPGTRVVVSTYTDGQLRRPEEIQALSEHLWDTRYAVIGPMQPPPDLAARPDGVREFLIQSREGQYLWLRLQLGGDGYSTPAVGSIRVHYPRESYLTYLPAVYSADDESRWFLERFLPIFQTEWDELERRIGDIAQYFDPDAVPSGDFLT